jgi:uncharacterized cupin superfamily protein
MRDLARVAIEEDERAYEPYALADGTPAGEVKLIRTRDDEGRALLVGLYRCEHAVAGEQDYADTNDAMWILEGEARVWTSDGEELHLVPGSFAAFRKGQSVRFEQSAGFKKFFVMSQ